MINPSKRFSAVILLSILATLPAVAVAEDASSQPAEQQAVHHPAPPPGGQGDPRQQMQQMEQMQQVMGPMMGMMMGHMIEGMSKAMARPEVAANFAAFARNYYQALVKQGFTEEQAMKIVTSAGIPSVGGKQ